MRSVTTSTRWAHGGLVAVLMLIGIGLPKSVPGPPGRRLLIFRMYGIYIVAFSVLAIAIAANGFRRGERWAWWALLVGNSMAFVSAMAYDRIVGAIGPFEMSEYLVLAAIYGSLAISFRSSRPRTRSVT